MRFIQTGVGGFGKGWATRLSENPDVEIVGLVDLSDKALEAARDITGCDEAFCFHSLDEALSEIEADALVCVTPPEFHAECVIKAMKAGLDVITEKPMADTMENGLSMLRASKETGRTCVVSQNYRYQLHTWTMAELVRQGRIGSVGQAKLDFYLGNDFGGGFRHEMDYPLLIDMSIHHFDLIRFITGLNPVSVRGEAWNPRWSNYRGDASCSVVFEMEEGVRVLYNGSWCAKGQYSSWAGNWLVEGDKGSLQYRDDTITVRDIPELYKGSDPQTIPPKALQKDSQDFVLNDFIESIRNHTRPKTDVADNIYSIAMVFAAVEAVQTGKRVPIEIPEG